MTIHRLPDGKLIIYSAVALNEAGMTELDALGDVGYIVVPHPMHTMDAAFFKDRYPNARVIAQPVARKKLSCVVDATASPARRQEGREGAFSRSSARFPSTASFAAPMAPRSRPTVLPS